MNDKWEFFVRAQKSKGFLETFYLFAYSTVRPFLQRGLTVTFLLYLDEFHQKIFQKMLNSLIKVIFLYVDTIMIF